MPRRSQARRNLALPDIRHICLPDQPATMDDATTRCATVACALGSIPWQLTRANNPADPGHSVILAEAGSSGIMKSAVDIVSHRLLVARQVQPGHRFRITAEGRSRPPVPWQPSVRPCASGAACFFVWMSATLVGPGRVCGAVPLARIPTGVWRTAADSGDGFVNSASVDQYG